MGFQAKSVYLRESECQVSVLQNQFPVPLFLLFFFLGIWHNIMSNDQDLVLRTDKAILDDEVEAKL